MLCLVPLLPHIGQPSIPGSAPRSVRDTYDYRKYILTHSKVHLKSGILKSN